MSTVTLRRKWSTNSLCVSLLPSSRILCISPITWTSKQKEKKISHSLLPVSILLPGQQRPSCRAPSVLGTHHRPVINVEWQSERGGREGEPEKDMESQRRRERETRGWKRLTTTERFTDRLSGLNDQRKSRPGHHLPDAYTTLTNLVLSDWAWISFRSVTHTMTRNATAYVGNYQLLFILFLVFI